MPKADKANNQTKPQPQSDSSKYVRNSDETALEGHTTIIGQMGSGKTTLAASASQFWPGDLPAKKKTMLEDMLWISFDRGGTAGLASCKLSVPSVIDGRAIIADKGVESGVELILEIAKKLIDATPSIEFVVLDTVSKLDAVLVEHYLRLHKNNSNKHAPWNDLLSRHGRLYNGVDKLNRRIISTFHTKAKLTDASPDQAKSRASMALPSEESELIHDISGQARKLYLSDASLKGAIYAVVNKREGTIRKFFPFGGKQMEGGCRYYELLDDEEPADLSKIFAKIKKGI